MVPSEVSGLYIVFLYTVDLLMNLATVRLCGTRPTQHRAIPHWKFFAQPSRGWCLSASWGQSSPSFSIPSVPTTPRCFNSYQVAPPMPKGGSLVNRNKHFSNSYFQCCSHLSKGWQGCQKLLDTVVARYSTRACAALLFARRNNIVYKKPCIGR